MNTAMQNRYIKQSAPFPWRLVQAFILNVLVLAFLWTVVTYKSSHDHNVSAFFAAIIFVGTIGLSLKMWFYTIVALTVTKAMNEDE